MFALVLIGGILLQSVANILNDYGDFVKGTDTVENHPHSTGLITGEIEPKEVLTVSAILLGIVTILGMVLTWYSGPWLLLIGIIGILGVATYTTGISYKYLGLGFLGPFLLRGIIAPIGTYYTMTGTITWEPFLLAVPNAFTVTGMLQGIP